MGESAPDILEATIDDIQQAYKSGSLPAVDWRSLPRSYRRLRQARAGAQFDYYPQRRGARPGGRPRLQRQRPVGPLHRHPGDRQRSSRCQRLADDDRDRCRLQGLLSRSRFVCRRKTKTGRRFDPRQIDSAEMAGATDGSLIRVARAIPTRGRFLRRVGGGGHGQPVCSGNRPGGSGIDPPAGCVELCRGHAHDRGLVSLAPVCTPAGRPWPARSAHALSPIRPLILDVIVGYDAAVATAHALAACRGFKSFLYKTDLRGARLGICASPWASTRSPTATTSKRSARRSIYAVGELKYVGAEIIDPIVIPQLKELLAKRASGPGDGEQAFRNYFDRSARRSSRSPKCGCAGNSAKSPVTPRARRARPGETLSISDRARNS